MLPTSFDPEKSAEVFNTLCSYAEENQLCAPEQCDVDAVFGNSPYLAALALRHPRETLKYLTTSPQTCFDELINILSQPRAVSEDDNSFMAFLREQKNRAALLIACADITQRWDLEQTTGALSNFAEKCISLATDKAFFKCVMSGDIAWPSTFAKDKGSSTIPKGISEHCGYFILGMGKLGGRELNYSSDIDLIALYDPTKIEYIGRKTAANCFVRMTQDIVRYIDQRTMNGYVFRVDLRLRPDPSATPIALNIAAAANYYHSAAVNWERAAMIKARFVAGDQTTATQYLKEMSGWVWRRNMDYEALKDIAAIKNQINRHYDTKETFFRGYDVKLGIGGIREVEFYAQVNQLLYAGRRPELRLRGTLATLDALVEAEFLPQNIATDIAKSYQYLRNVEHRIQMLHDEQSHTIPTDERQLMRLTSFMGYETIDQFEQELRAHTKVISTAYDALLPDTDNDGATLPKKTLTSIMQDGGFNDIAAATAIITGWQQGKYRSLKTRRAQDLLADCLPSLLEALSQASPPDSALVRFDHFLAQLPAGVQLFSLLKSNPALFRLLGRVMSLAPALSSTLAKSPSLWDAVLDSSFFAPITDGDDMQRDQAIQLSTARDFQDVLDMARRFVAEQKFRAGVQMLEGIADAQEVGCGLSVVADYTFQKLIPVVEEEFAERHGWFNEEHSGIAMIALGKYGGKELTHTSDIDVIFLYDTNSSDTFSNGPKPLMPNVYYARLAQHVVTAITALTPEGRLFDVDTRLRPSGAQGPLAVTVATLEEYYKSSAWTWEFLALTRARIIFSSAAMADKINTVIQQAIMSGETRSTLQEDTAKMRQKLREQFDTGNPLEVKHSAGGLVDIEFICQYLILKHASAHGDIMKANILDCIDALATNKIISKGDAKQLSSAYKLQQQIQAMLRLCLETVPSTIDDIPDSLATTIADASGYKDNAALIASLKNEQLNSHKLFLAIIGNPKE